MGDRVHSGAIHRDSESWEGSEVGHPALRSVGPEGVHPGGCEVGVLEQSGGSRCFGYGHSTRLTV